MKFKTGDHVRVQDQHPLWFGPHELVLAEAPVTEVAR